MNIKIILATIVLAISSQASSTATSEVNSIDVKAHNNSLTDSKEMASMHNKTSFDKDSLSKFENVKGRNKLDFDHAIADEFKLKSLAYTINTYQENNTSQLKGRNLNINHFESVLALYSSDQKGTDKFMELVLK